MIKNNYCGIYECFIQLETSVRVFVCQVWNGMNGDSCSGNSFMFLITMGTNHYIKQLTGRIILANGKQNELVAAAIYNGRCHKN